MRFKLLGNSGLRVSEVALGTMTFGEDWGWGASKQESQKIFDAYVSAGGNFIDTAINYTNGTSEKFIGEFIQKDRDYFIIATKYTLYSGLSNKNDPNAGGNHRKNMMRSVENSLKSLNTDYIDLYWLHAWDGITPVDEVMRGLEDLVRAGKVLHIGISDTPAWVISKAKMLAELRGWAPVIAIQVPYSLADRSIETELIPMAKAEGLAITVWGILGAGVLTGKYRDSSAVKRYEEASDRSKQIGDSVVSMAKAMGVTPSQIAVNWVRQRPWGGSPIIPILGARRVEQIKENLEALSFSLTNEQIAALDALAPPRLGFPEEFLMDDEVRGLIFGNTYHLIDNHRA